jgi:hypothetical protein
MRRLLALLLISSLIAVTVWACDGDDDDEPDATATAPSAATPTSPASGSTSTPSAQPTLEAGIIIEQPVAGNVRSPITMLGRANVFEAALTIDAQDEAGNTLCTRHVMATAGTGTEGTWEGILAFDPPETETQLTLRAYTFSPMDGSVQDLVETGVILSSENPAIVINTPACAANVGNASLTVEGMALVFEAVLHVDIRDSSGTVLATNRVMSANGTEFSFWTTTFDLSGLSPGFYDLVAYNLSARDGEIENEFPVQISVGP